VLYQASVPGGGTKKLEIDGLRNYTVVLVNGRAWVPLTAGCGGKA
jgi:hypothetical protein